MRLLTKSWLGNQERWHVMAQETNLTILGDTSVVQETQNPQEAEGSTRGESAARKLRKETIW
jgi:hypothetical protein